VVIELHPETNESSSVREMMRDETFTWLEIPDNYRRYALDPEIRFSEPARSRPN